jgi:hypothetical protein
VGPAGFEGAFRELHRGHEALHSGQVG